MAQEKLKQGVENVNISTDSGEIVLSENPRHMLPKTVIIVGAITLFLIVLVISAYILSAKGRIETASVSTTPQKIKTAVPTPENLGPSGYQFKIPNLYPNLSWTRVDFRDQRIKSPGLYYNYEPLEVTVSGEEWSAKLSVETDKNYTELISAFRSYYQDTFENLRWKSETKIDGKTLMPTVADGPTGSLWGYLDITDGKMKVVMLNYNTTFSPSKTLPLVCPCNVEFRVFESAVIDLNATVLK